MKANTIKMNRMNDLWSNGENYSAPLGAFKNKELAGALESHGADKVVVEYKTYPGYEKRDRATYSRRLKPLAELYEIGEWEPLVIRGYTQSNTFICKLTRK